MNQLQTQASNKFEIMTDSGIIKLDPMTVRNYIVGSNTKITDQEVMMFIGFCKANKLNPMNKDVHLIKYGDAPATWVTSKDVFLKRAITNPKYRGMKSGIVILNSDGAMIEREGTIHIKGQETILGAWAEVKREGWEDPTRVTVAFEEYAGMKGNALNAQWAKRPGFMIQKVAESQALRKTFVDDMQGMYTEEEMNVDLSTVPAPQPQQQEVITVDPDDMPFDHKQAPKKNDGRKFL